MMRETRWSQRHKISRRAAAATTAQKQRLLRAGLLVLAGGIACSVGNIALAQPINLLAPDPASPQPPPRQGISLPMMPAITPSRYATAMPLLEAAETAVAGRRYRLASQQLEAAETSLLNDGARPNGATITPGGQALTQVHLAQDAVARRDREAGLTAISMAIGAAQEPLPPSLAAVPPVPPPIVMVPIEPPPVPMITKAILPGHWQEGSWQYRWVPPDTTLRPVETRSQVQGRFVFEDGIGWIWVPTHYGE